jgi:hypothetical protein
MGSVTGGLSAVYQLALNTTVQIPLTAADPSLTDSVLLYNYSPYLVEVQTGIPVGWLGAWSVDRFKVDSTTNIKCTPIQIVGQPPAAPAPPVASLTAAFILNDEAAIHTGTYPCTLLGRVGPVPATEVDLYDSQGRLVGQILPLSWQFLNPDTHIGIKLHNDSNNFPTFEWIQYASDNVTPQNVTFLNVVQDGLGGLQLGINGPQRNDARGDRVLDRSYMFDSIWTLGPILQATQGRTGGQLAMSDTASFVEYWIRNVKQGGLTIDGNGIYPSGGTGAVDTWLRAQGANWTVLGFANGWGWGGNPFWGPSALALPDGRVMLRGYAVGGTLTGGTLAMTIPATDSAGNKLRPTPGSGANGTLWFNSSSANAGVNALVQIETNGNVTVWPGSSAGIMLEGIQYQAHF